MHHIDAMRLVIALVLLLPACWLRDQCSEGESVCGASEKVIECVDGQYYEGNHRCCPTGSRCFEGEDADGNDVAGCTLNGASDARCAGKGSRKICDGPTLVQCDTLEHASSEERCTGECVVDSTGHAACAVGTDARCARFANPTSFGCDGTTLYECHEGRLVGERSCDAAGATCREGDFELAACVRPATCTFPSARCENGAAIVCTAEGGFETIEPCSNGEVCDASGTHAAWCGTPRCW